MNQNQKELSFLKLDVESIKDVIDHSQIRNNASFLHSGIKRLLEEVDRLYSILEYIESDECEYPKEVANSALNGKYK